MRLRSILGIGLITILAGACTPDQPTSPSEQLSPGAVDSLIVLAPPTGTCAAVPSQIRTAIIALFLRAGFGSSSAAVAQFNQILDLLAANNQPDAQDLARQLANTLLERYEALPARRKVIAKPLTEFIVRQLFCLVGIQGVVFSVPLGQDLAVVTQEGDAGVYFPPDVVPPGTLITITELPPDSDPLDTPLDKYPSYLEMEKYPDLPLGANKPVVAVCFPEGTDPGIALRLLLGHQADLGFEILPRVTVDQALLDLLDCEVTNPEPAPTSRLGRMLNRIAEFVLPPKVQAAAMFARGGVGGSPGEFSPFGAVDPFLKARGGVGGSPGEFAPRADPFASVSLPPNTIEGVTGSFTETGLPTVTVETEQGTRIPGVTVVFSTGPAVTLDPDGDASVCAALTNGAPLVTVEVPTDENGEATLPCLAFGGTAGFSNLKVTFSTASLSFPGAELVGVGGAGNPTQINYLVWAGEPAPDWQASGYSYLLTTQNGGPAGFEAPGFDDSDWPVGAAPFGGGPVPFDGCTLFNTDAPFITLWPIGSTAPEGGSDILIRKRFAMPAAGQISVQVAIDNDVQVFLNGVDISGGLKTHEGCATRPGIPDPFTFIASAPAGENVIAIRARDRGVISYLDVRVAPYPPLD